METFVAILFLMVGAALGGAAVWFRYRGEVERRISAEARLAAEQETQARMRDTFHSLASQALERNNGQFLYLAKETFESKQNAIDELVKPLRESLTAVDKKIQQLEVARTSAYSVLTEQVKSLSVSQAQLHDETANLVKALRAPATRGRWGEIQLKRTVEMAGMLERCDFREQQTIHTEDGRLRPDMVVHLPNSRRVVVDAKAPLAAYLDAIEAPDESARAARMRDHAGQIRTHITKLAAKAYWSQFDHAPEFVVIFLPGEPFFSAALQHDPDLIQFGIEQRVLLATPTTLIALLKTIAHGWREERVTQNALEISKLGKEIYERLAVLAGHFGKMGDHLEKATKCYNDTVGALERRVLPSARRMKDYGATVAEDIPVLEEVDLTPRRVSAPELASSPAESGPSVTQ